MVLTITVRVAKDSLPEDIACERWFILQSPNMVMVLFAFVGACVGSFLNVVADRLPLGMSIISPPSYCPSCHHRLKIKDLIPVFSYLWLKGHCRYCGAAIPRRSLYVELTTGVLFAFLFWHYGLGWQLAIVSGYYCLFLVLLVIDLEHNIIPNKVVYPGMVIALIVSIWAGLGIKSAAIGGSIGLVFLLLPALIFKGAWVWGMLRWEGWWAWLSVPRWYLWHCF